MGLLADAVADNVQWCALASGGGIDRGDVWTVADRPPALFPDAVTLAPGVDAHLLAGLLADRPSCSVKDSFADVDLAPHGFELLFEAQWIGRPAAAPESRGWTRVVDLDGLRAWCTAARLPEVLPSTVTVEPSVRVLAARRGDVVAAGAILTGGGAVVGLSNVFGPTQVWDELAPIAAEHCPGLPVVGYEHGPDLDAALTAGFGKLGPLRVWLRS